MRSSQEITKEISAIKKKIEAVETAIFDKQGELDQVRKVHAMLVIESAGGKQPASVQVQRQKIQNHESDIEVLSQGLAELKTQLQELESKKDVCEIQAGALADYLQRQDEYVNLIENLEGEIRATFRQIGLLTEAWDTLKETQNPVYLLQSLLASLRPGQTEQLDLSAVNLEPIGMLATSLGPYVRRAQDFSELVQAIHNHSEFLRMSLRALDLPEQRTPNPEPPPVKVTIEKATAADVAKDPIAHTELLEKRRDRILDGQYNRTKNLNQVVET